MLLPKLSFRASFLDWRLLNLLGLGGGLMKTAAAAEGSSLSMIFGCSEGSREPACRPLLMSLRVNTEATGSLLTEELCGLVVVEGTNGDVGPVRSVSFDARRRLLWW